MILNCFHFDILIYIKYSTLINGDSSIEITKSCYTEVKPKLYELKTYWYLTCLTTFPVACNALMTALEASQDTHGQDTGWGPPERNRQVGQGGVESSEGHGLCPLGPATLARSTTTPPKKSMGQLGGIRSHPGLHKQDRTAHRNRKLS